MKKLTDKKKFTQEEIDAKAKEISASLGGSKVTPFVFEENEEDGQVIGFLREPSLPTKLRTLDSMGPDKQFTTGAALLDSILIREHSDPRITDGIEDHQVYYLGAAIVALDRVKAAQNQIKKK